MLVSRKETKVVQKYSQPRGAMSELGVDAGICEPKPIKPILRETRRMGRPSTAKKSSRTLRLGHWPTLGLRLLFGRNSDDAWWGLTHDHALSFVLFRLFLFSSWCVLVSHSHSLP